MPRRAKVPCKHSGCPNLIEPRARYCKDHEKHKRTERWGRSGDSKNYQGAWPKIRRMHLNRNPLCVACESRGQITAANEVDHIIPLSQGGTHDEANLQSLCKPCHSRKTARESNQKMKGE